LPYGDTARSGGCRDGAALSINVLPAGGRGALFLLQVIIPSAWLEFWKALGAAR